jgi:hypothetical protein
MLNSSSNARPDPSFSSLSAIEHQAGPDAAVFFVASHVSRRTLGSGLTFEHLKIQMSEYQT